MENDGNYLEFAVRRTIARDVYEYLLENAPHLNEGCRELLEKLELKLGAKKPNK